GCQREQRTGCGGRGGACCRVPAEVEMRDQHDDDAGKADQHCRPAIDADALFQDNSSERDSDKRRREENCCGVRERQASQRGEVGEHTRYAQGAATELSERPARAHRRAQLATDRIITSTGRIAKALRKKTICPTGATSPSFRTRADMAANNNAEISLRPMALKGCIRNFLSQASPSAMRHACVVSNPYSSLLLPQDVDS